ncbi:phosphoethanolamine transferase [Alysiella crassa]|uniref:Phosphoethanolamine transferase CptA n=1 Tax=Alysiella crassa TaxID=153491 RepID=A0A376BU71_9NEIS|nr:phosphoethanolamine transferase [Alysiella crassa]SSY80343.1 Phosphoethanolamine transferase CptA [Alysiella crassa]
MSNTHFLKNLLILLLPALLVGGLLSIAGDKADGLKIGLLSLCGGAVMLLAYAKHSKIMAWIASVWWVLFVAHSLILSASWLWYDSSLDAYFVTQSLANTTFHESVEFLQLHAFNLVVMMAAVVLTVFAYVFILKKYFNPSLYQQAKRWHKIVMFILLLIGVAAWAIRPIRALSPPIYWQTYHHKIKAFRNQTAQHQTWQQNWLNQARENGIYDNVPAQQTMVLVLSESLTSFNLSVCDYPRETTPELHKRLPEIRIWCNAYSPYPSTLNALKAMLTDVPSDNPDFTPTQSLQAYAKQAGFKTFWLSNQDDSYLSSLFGSFADVAVYNNKRSGRSSVAKDAELLPHFQAALNDVAPRKLIIVHLIGSHPNYSARYSAEFARFPNSNDAAVEQAVATQLQQANAGFWVKQQRDDYDNSVLYQDFVLSELLKSLQHNQAAVRSLIFVSDHGNEVGHEKDFAGHSPKTRAGYRVPIVMWDSRNMLPTGADKNTPIDAAQLDENALNLMGIKLKNANTTVIWHEQNYHFPQIQNFPYWEK